VKFARVCACALVLALALSVSCALSSCGKKAVGAGGNLEDKRQKAMEEGASMKGLMGGKAMEQGKAQPPAGGGAKAPK
jgi:hypothetical protein